MQAGVGDDPDRDRPRRERDEPDPVARVHQVVRRQPPQARLLHPPEPLGVVRPVLDVHALGEAEPGRVDVVRRLAFEAELPAEERGAAGRPDEPARRQRPLLAVAEERDAMPLVAELDVLDDAAVAEVGAGGEHTRRELVLEATAVELVRRQLRPERRPVLGALRDVAVVARRQEEAHAHLRQLIPLDVILQPEHAPEVVRADLERRLADLERGLGRRPLPLLGHEHRRLGSRSLQLQGDGQPGEAAAEDGDVVVILHWVLLAGRPSSLTPPFRPFNLFPRWPECARFAA